VSNMKCIRRRTVAHIGGIGGRRAKDGERVGSQVKKFAGTNLKLK